MRTFLIVNPAEWSGSNLDVVSLYQYNPDNDSTGTGNIYKPVLLDEESIAIDDVLDISRKVELPENIAYGPYVLYSKISYQDITATATDVAKISTKGIPSRIPIIIMTSATAGAR